MSASLVGSEMCIRDRAAVFSFTIEPAVVSSAVQLVGCFSRALGQVGRAMLLYSQGDGPLGPLSAP
eukprot:1519662-Alexandrium_andersonii.AAC.1